MILESRKHRNAAMYFTNEEGCQETNFWTHYFLGNELILLQCTAIIDKLKPTVNQNFVIKMLKGDPTSIKNS